MSTLLLVALVLTGWTVLSLPLGVVVGRCLAGAADLTDVSEFHTLEA